MLVKVIFFIALTTLVEGRKKPPHPHKWKLPVPDYCPGFTPVDIISLGPLSNFYDRFYLYKSTPLDDSEGAKCGFSNIKTDCKCTFMDVIRTNNAIQRVEYSKNAVSENYNIKFYDATFIKSGKGYVMSHPDNGGPLYEVDVASDNYETFALTIICNNRVNGKNVVLIKTKQPVPSEETLKAIDEALKKNGIDESSLVTINQESCNYPSIDYKSKGLNYIRG